MDENKQNYSDNSSYSNSSTPNYTPNKCITGIYSNDNGFVKSYFQFYSKLLNQQNMLQDYVRTSTYFSAIQNNIEDFQDKKVLDLGTGSGILAILSAAAGANRVYAVEASDSIRFAKKLIQYHNYEEKINLINKKIEDLTEKEISKVDTIISEPLGILLVNERMLESYIIARDKFLINGGKLYPSSATIHVVPFCDENLYKEQISKTFLWDNENFFGLNMTCLKAEALKEKLRQPVIDLYDPSIHISEHTCRKDFNFYTLNCNDLINFEIKLEFQINKATLMHGISSWFDTNFQGSKTDVALSTSPYSNPTHWYQVRLLLPEPLAINKGQTIFGTLTFSANEMQSYFINLRIGIPEQNIWIENCYDLKDPEFRGFSTYTNNQQKTQK